MNLTRIAISAAAVLALGACATNKPPPQELVDAAAAVQQAQANPIVMTNAPLELKKATDTLERANSLNAKGAAFSEVTTAAYVAQRQAQTAVAVATAKANDDRIRSAETDRERARADAREREAAASRNMAQAARSDAAMAEQNAAMARQRAAAAEGQASVAIVAAAQTEQRNQELQQQTAALTAQLNELNAKQTERGMLVTLGDVLFEVNRSEVKPGSMEALRKLADFMRKHPDRNVLIEGYTDSTGSASYNESLSRKRAESVAAALKSLGVASDKVKFVGYGEAYPVSANNTESNRAMNRRVEVYISEDQQPVRARNG